MSFWKYDLPSQIRWLQEETENMGPWVFVRGRLYERFDDTHEIMRISRYESGSPATGSHSVHLQEQENLVDRAVTV